MSDVRKDCAYRVGTGGDRVAAVGTLRGNMDGIRSTHYPLPMTMTLYGIRNCDTMKKARAWLDARGVTYAFHDYKVAGIDAATLSAWASSVGWETLLNRAGTTFRALTDAEKADLDAAKAIALMVANPSMIKRPVLTGAAGVPLVGFSAAAYEAALP